MKKEAVINQKKDVKPAVNVKRNPGKKSNVKKTGGTVKKAAVEMEQSPEQQVADSAIVPPISETEACQDSTEQVEVVAESELAVITESSPEPQTAAAAIVTIPKESKVLRERLGLNGYITETVKLPSTLEILGCKAEGVVFARQIEGVPIDRILLHVTLVSATGKHSMGVRQIYVRHYQAAARCSQKSSQRLLKMLQRRAIILFAPLTVQCIPDCFSL